MFEILILLMGSVILGLSVEKMIHVNYDLIQVTFALKQDVIKFIKAIFCEPVVRHQFDATLVDDIKMILKPYAKVGFEIQMMNQIFREVPVLGIRFVPDRQFEERELQELSGLLCVKMREYMGFYGFSWKIFSAYSIGSDYVSVYIYYAEWECDTRPFTNTYRKLVRQKTGRTGGILRDEELDAELRNVD